MIQIRRVQVAREVRQQKRIQTTPAQLPNPGTLPWKSVVDQDRTRHGMATGRKMAGALTFNACRKPKTKV